MDRLACGFPLQDQHGARRFAKALVHAVHSRHPDRLLWRTTRSTCATLNGLLKALRPAVIAKRVDHWHDFIRRQVGNRELLKTLAQFGIQWMRTCRAAKERTSFHSSVLVKRIVGLLRTGVRSNAFPKINDPSWLSIGTVWTAMQRLATEDPGNWSFAVPAHLAGRAPCPKGREISADDVHKLIIAAEDTPREQLMVIILRSTGLRVEALTLIRIDHIWDRDTEGPATSFNVPEKLSTTRVVIVTSDMDTAIRKYIAKLGPDEKVWPVFAFGRFGTKDPPSRRTIFHRLTRLAQTADIPPLAPHSFRRFFVNDAADHGARLSTISLAIGHKNVGTTFRYYWTANVNEQVNRILDEPEADRKARLQNELAEVEQQITNVQAEIDEMRTPRIQTSPTASDNIAPGLTAPEISNPFDRLLRDLAE